MDNKFFCAKPNGKLHYPHTMLTGFGFMAVQIAWIIYNAYVPLILRENSTIANLAWSSTAVGIIMVIDNIFGVIFQPLFGRISDRTHTRFGKRKPFLMYGIPLCALLFIFIPRIQVLGILMLDIIVFNFLMSTWRSPVVAMMPDFTPSEIRGEGNAIINIMGGIGVVLGTVAGKIITFIAPNATEAQIRDNVFIFGSVVMVVCLLVVLFFVKEPDSRITKEESLRIKADYEKANPTSDEKQSIKSMGLTKGEKKSLIFMLIALFFNSNATDSINTYFTSFATTELGFSSADASLVITLFAAFTGYYYTATFSASIVGPVLVGGMFDLTKLMTPDGQVNYWSLFIYCPICFALALLCMSQVKHGETQTISKETIDKIKEENED